MDKEIKIKKIEIQIGDSIISVSVEDAKTLRRLLCEMFGGDTIYVIGRTEYPLCPSPYYPLYPEYPEYPEYPWTYTTGEEYKTSAVMATGDGDVTVRKVQ